MTMPVAVVKSYRTDARLFGQAGTPLGIGMNEKNTIERPAVH